MFKHFSACISITFKHFSACISIMLQHFSLCAFLLYSSTVYVHFYSVPALFEGALKWLLNHFFLLCGGGGLHQGNEIFIITQRCDEKMRRLKNQRKPIKTMKSHKQLRKHENKHRKSIRATCQMVTKIGRRRFSSRKRDFHHPPTMWWKNATVEKPKKTKQNHEKP